MTFRKLSQTNIKEIQTFFSDELTQKFVGDENWINSALERPSIAIGKNFKFAKVLDRFGLVVYDNQQAIGYVEMELYDRRLRDHENDLYEKDGKTANFVYVIDPNQRGKGYGGKLIENLINKFQDIKIWIASTDFGNDVSEYILKKAGFILDNEDTDGTKNWVYIRV